MLSNDVGCLPRFSAWVIGEIASLQPGQILATATAAWATVDSPSDWPCKSTSITNQTGNSAVSPATPRPMQCQEFRFGWICKQLQNHCRNSHNWGSIARHIFRLSSALVTQNWALDTVLQDFSNCNGGGVKKEGGRAGHDLTRVTEKKTAKQQEEFSWSCSEGQFWAAGDFIAIRAASPATSPPLNSDRCLWN